MTEISEHSAMQVKTQELRRDVTLRITGRKRQGLDRKQLYCDNCEMTGHMRDTCFKIHGYPEWYKELHDQRKKKGVRKGFAAAVEDKTPAEQKPETLQTAQITEIVKQVMKLMKEKTPLDPVKVNFAHLDEFTSMNQTHLDLDTVTSNT